MNKKLIIAITILLCVNNIYGQIVEEGNIAKYYFNEANANDEIGSNNGVIFGATPSNDRFENEENAFLFNNAFIRIDHDEILYLGTSEFSISAWFKTENNDNYGVIFNKGEGSGSMPRIFIRTMESPQNTIQWRVGNGVNNVTETYTDPSLFDNEWHHVVLVRNTNSLSLYLDASLVNFTSANELSSINTNSNRPILIGVQDSILSSNTPFGNYFDGFLDDYRIYNRAINELEVDSLYNEGNPITNTIQLLESVEMTIIPNPFIDEINVKIASELMTKINYEIINSSGKTVKSGNLENSKINVTSLRSGIYYLRLFNQQRVIGIKKLLKFNK